MTELSPEDQKEIERLEAFLSGESTGKPPARRAKKQASRRVVRKRARDARKRNRRR